jgi:transposase
LKNVKIAKIGAKMANYTDKNGNVLTQEEVDFIWKNDGRITDEIKEFVDFLIYTKDDVLKALCGIKRTK